MYGLTCVGGTGGTNGRVGVGSAGGGLVGSDMIFGAKGAGGSTLCGCKVGTGVGVGVGVGVGWIVSGDTSGPGEAGGRSFAGGVDGASCVILVSDSICTSSSGSIGRRSICLGTSPDSASVRGRSFTYGAASLIG
ncbi:hypothetical protein AV540_21330 [Brevibacillus parabrevis]|nr:hypothetical protein AV540_21330 [Brevibacillus parabrevis]